MALELPFATFQTVRLASVSLYSGDLHFYLVLTMLASVLGF